MTLAVVSNGKREINVLVDIRLRGPDGHLLVCHFAIKNVAEARNLQQLTEILHFRQFPAPSNQIVICWTHNLAQLKGLQTPKSLRRVYTQEIDRISGVRVPKDLRSMSVFSNFETCRPHQNNLS